MLGSHDFWLFIVSGLVLNITSGPDTAYIVGRSAQFGWRGGGMFIYLGARIAVVQAR